MEQRIDGKTMNITQENIEKLREIFPEVFTENKIDFEKLQVVLGENIEKSNEKYEFSWNGKFEAMKIAQTQSTGTLIPCKTQSKNWDTTENLYIEGDNLEVLKLLQKSYVNKIKMIYIDPPYNTGNDFVYKDNFADNISNYKEITKQSTKSNAETSGRYHTNWLNMIYPRLKLSRNLLTDDGVIFISIDDHEFSNLKKICDEIFGENNFVGEIIWQTATDNNPTQISIEHEYILCYAKKLDIQPKWLVRSSKAEKIQQKYYELKKLYQENIVDISKELKAWIKKNESELDGVSHYNSVDEFGVYYPGNSSNTRDGGYKFDIIHPITGKVCKKPDFGYRWTEETFLEASKRGDVEWGKDESTIPHIKKRLETVQEMLKSYYYEDNRAWTSYLTKLMGDKVFDNPKSLNLLQKLIKFTTSDKDIILDFFSGSASTADAVMRQNIIDECNRKYIMVQFPENLDENLKNSDSKAKPIIVNAIKLCDSLSADHNICEVAKERIRRAGEKIQEETSYKIETGFKVFKLDSSNLNKWNNSPVETTDELVTRIQQNLFYLKEDRNNIDLVYEIMLKYGLPLSSPVQEKVINNKNVYITESNGYNLLVCLEQNLSIDTIEKITDEPVKTFVFADHCFADANMLINTEEILKKKAKNLRIF